MYNIDDKGNVTLIQGDDLIYTIQGVPTDKNYTVHFEIKDKNRNTVNEPIVVNSNYSDIVEFFLPGNYTNSLTVKKNQPSQEYTFAIKLCSTNPDREDTLSICGKGIEEQNIITVYPKGAEGI